MFFILIFLPKAISFHIWRLKCICIFLLFTKKYGAEVCKFLDFMASPSQTYMKWPLWSWFHQFLKKRHFLVWIKAVEITNYLWILLKNSCDFTIFSTSSLNTVYCSSVLLKALLATTVLYYMQKSLLLVDFNGLRQNFVDLINNLMHKLLRVENDQGRG